MHTRAAWLTVLLVFGCSGSGSHATGGAGGNAGMGALGGSSAGGVPSSGGSGGDVSAGGAAGAGGHAPEILAARPPMGWNSWNKFGCSVSEDMIKSMADAMVSSGMKDAGYEYVNIDDCWQTDRATDGTIIADPTNFPSGMQALADYVHALGLKLGLYSDRGTKTCAGRPGSEAHEVQDANTYAAWGVDYLKYDNCNATLDQQTQYETMSAALVASGRPIVFSICAWSFATWMPATGQLWRTTGDISDSWPSVVANLDVNQGLAQYAAPGHWNDPDMLEVGNGGLSDAEYRSHFSLWAMMAAPLIAGNDLRSMPAATSDILTAPEIIAIDQDPAGKQGTRVVQNGELEVWSKELATPNTRAVALLNRSAAAADITVRWTDVGLGAGSATVRDAWARSDVGSFTDQYVTSVASHATAVLIVAQ